MKTMKKSYYFYAAGMYAILLAVVLATSCSDMDADYEKYFIQGEHVYAAKVDSVAPRPGKQRILLEMFVESYRVSTARVFWNNRADSLDFAIDGPGKYEAFLENMAERSYIFQIISFDEFGNRSLPVEVSSRVYGENYQARLVNRPMRTASVNNAGVASITWGEADISGGTYASEVRYTDQDGNIKVQNVSVDELSSVIADIKPNTAFEYRTVYQPDSLSIDLFYTDYATVDRIEFDKGDWSIIARSSQHGGTDNGVANFIDGTAATRWHTQAGVGLNYPHYATIDMGAVKTINQVGLWLTTFENPNGDVRAASTFQLEVSNDNVSWTVFGVFDLAKRTGEQTFDLPEGTEGRYLKFVGLSGPDANMVMGEISAYAKF
jgi:hypothetical protein